jgi:hypothetical protein
MTKGGGCGGKRNSCRLTEAEEKRIRRISQKDLMTGCSGGIRFAMPFLAQASYKLRGLPTKRAKKVNHKESELHSLSAQFESRTDNRQHAVLWFSLNSTSCQVSAPPSKILLYFNTTSDRRMSVQSRNSKGFVHCNSSLWRSEVCDPKPKATCQTGPHRIRHVPSLLSL